MNILIRNLPSLVVLIAMAVISVLAFDSLPEEVPSRFDLDGTVLDTQPRNVAVALLPVVYIFSLVLVNLLVRISPRKFSMPESKRAMEVILFGVGVMLLFIHAGMMFGQDAPFSFTAWGVAAFFIVVGNVFGKTERNFYIGYRIPWTLASNANWKATHRMAGRIMVISGVLLAVISLFFTLGPLVILFIVVPALLPIFYSVYYYFRYERDEETAE